MTTTSGPADAVIELRGIRKTYRSGDVAVPVLHGIDLTVRKGEMVAVMGPSGSGKSTLMNILGCLDVPTSGIYVLDGVNMGRLNDAQLARLRNRRIGFVFQSFNLLPRTSAVENVALPLAYRGMGPQRYLAARAALTRVGLAHRAKHYPSQLSGGEQQRVAIARALVTRPSLLLADEPSGNLDSHSSEQVLAILQGLNSQDGMTIVMVTHEPDVAQHCGRIVVLRDGLVVSDQMVESRRVATERKQAVAP